jgi:hydrogenase 3 maturation protease
MKNNNLLKKLKKELAKKPMVMILGIGNSMRGDDGFGPQVIKKLKQAGIKCTLINGGTVPESYSGLIIKTKPDLIIFLDCANFSGYPGELRIIKEKDIPCLCLSTHQMPISFLTTYLQRETGAKILIIGVQGKEFGFGEISKEIKESLEKLAQLFIELIQK